VRDAVGDRAAVTAKLNMADGVSGGLWLEDSLAVAALMESDGVLDAIELTGGSSLANPMYLFRGEAPLREFGATLPGPARLGFKLVGRRFLRAYPYEEAFFLPYARQFLDALSLPLILLGGITRLETIESALAEGFAFVAMARALLREPDLITRMQAGSTTSSLCIHCNQCMPTIYSGTRCVLVKDAVKRKVPDGLPFPAALRGDGAASPEPAAEEAARAVLATDGLTDPRNTVTVAGDEVTVSVTTTTNTVMLGIVGISTLTVNANAAARDVDGVTTVESS